MGEGAGGIGMRMSVCLRKNTPCDVPFGVPLGGSCRTHAADRDSARAAAHTHANTHTHTHKHTHSLSSLSRARESVLVLALARFSLSS